MRKKAALLGETVFTLVIVALCSLIIAVAKGYHPSMFGYEILRVLTRSMAPALEENALILIRDVPQDEIEVGDIITFVSDDPTLMGFYNTHRVYHIKRDEETGETYYITKGDMNEEADLYPVSYDAIAGELVCEIPFSSNVGKLIVSMINNRVYFFVVMLPLLLCLISYLWQIFYLLVIKDEDEDEQERENEGREK
ncbi:MAG: signal peptidase I [Lachnospiraceae bacterium]|nr:signal peptidase I [Lachnospiraceae bacterium]